MEITKSEIRGKHMFPEHYFFKLQTAEINFKKLLGGTVFKNLIFVSSAHLWYLLCYFNLPLMF